jgi:hypothetical protein
MVGNAAGKLALLEEATSASWKKADSLIGFVAAPEFTGDAVVTPDDEPSWQRGHSGLAGFLDVAFVGAPSCLML